MSFGKGDSGQSYTYAQTPETTDMTGLMESYMGYMQTMMADFSAQQEALITAMSEDQLEAPPAYTGSIINFEEEAAQAQSKAEADIASENARRKGLTDTRYGSVLEDEDPTTTSVLA